MYRVGSQFIVLLAALCACCPALSQEPSGSVDSAASASGESTTEVKAAIASYVASFNARDAQKLADHWLPNSVYTSRSTGEQIVGRAAIQAEFASIFANTTAPKLAVATETIDFVSPNVALERGIATVTPPDGEPELTEYSVVYVKQNGRWLIDRVSEESIVVAPSNHEYLAELEWLIGEWIDESDDLIVEFSCQWTTKQNYISRTYKVTDADGLQSSGLQIIGWDPIQKQIRSWLFDSDGGFVRGTWTQKDNKWVVQSIATLADGRSGSFTSVFRPLGDGTYGWEKINRVLDGRLLPNVDETVVRPKL